MSNASNTETRYLEAVNYNSGYALSDACRDIDDLRAKLETAEKTIRTLRAGFRWQVDALETLQKMLDSQNEENPWLGITAALALALNEGENLEKRYAELWDLCKDEIRPYLNRNAYIGDDPQARSLVDQLLSLLSGCEPKAKE